MSLKNRVIGLAAIGAAAAILAPSALAKAPVSSSPTSFAAPTLKLGSTCEAPVSQVFAAWGDTSYYSSVEGSSFESGAGGWTATGGAKVVRDSSDGNLGDGLRDSYSLQLGPDSSVTSPEICVGTDSAYYRFFSHATVVGSTSQNLKVEVLLGGRPVAIATVASGLGSSVPSPKLPFVPAEIDQLLGVYSPTTTVRIRATTLGGATVRLDDVYMDPRMR